ncbi:MAG TPA: sensor histidine kinase [Acidobacteriota bacterium]|nr:sensor histidine kinase [Acidobacteriota bacterium]
MIGFSFVIIVLGTMIWLSLREIGSIRSNAAFLVREHQVTSQLMDDLELEQQRASGILLNAVRITPNPRERRLILADVDEFEKDLTPLVLKGQIELPVQNWNELKTAVQQYCAAIRQTVTAQDVTKADAEILKQRYERFLVLSGEVIKQNSIKSAEIGKRIEVDSLHLARQTEWYLGGSLVLSGACLVLTIQFSFKSLKKMEWQAQELNRVSWGLIAGQETAARRFSHEMHDELGQSLTGLKATLIALTPEDLPHRRADCLELLDEAITNVRELSQLLRPVILDDFGLDAALQWLVERFQDRTRIQVEFESNFHERLDDEVETHMFRITQEALSNIAKHSSATLVSINLVGDSDQLLLTIKDNGVGLKNKSGYTPGLGLVGMRARTQHINGEFRLSNELSGGVKIEVSVPLRAFETEYV